MAWMQTLSGAAFDLNAPDPRKVNITEIAVSLSCINRYNGHSREPWNVAAHSVLCVQLLPADASPELKLAVLLHDAKEAFTCDMTSPVQEALAFISPAALAAFKRLQDDIQYAIHLRFDLQPVLDQRDTDAIKRVDALALAIERRDLMAPCEREWNPSIPPAPAGWPRLRRSNALMAEWRFMQTFAAIMVERDDLDA